MSVSAKCPPEGCFCSFKGLKSAKTFIERYSEPLEELDLGLLLKFPPLQDALIDSFGTMSDLLSSAELTITECLRQATPQKMRLFIWTLEEHRDEYPSCHTVLDEYFAMGEMPSPLFCKLFLSCALRYLNDVLLSHLLLFTIQF